MKGACDKSPHQSSLVATQHEAGADHKRRFESCVTGGVVSHDTCDTRPSLQTIHHHTVSDLQHWLSIIIGRGWIWIAGSDVFLGALPSSYPGWCCLLWTNGRFSYDKMQGATHGYGSGRINTHQNSLNRRSARDSFAAATGGKNCLEGG